MKGILTLSELMLTILEKAPVYTDEIRSNVHHFLFHLQTFENSLGVILGERIFFNRWRDGPGADFIDVTLDNLIFFRLIEEGGNIITITNNGRSYLQKMNEGKSSTKLEMNRLKMAKALDIFTVKFNNFKKKSGN